MSTIPSLSLMFIGFVVLVAAAIVGILMRLLPRRAAGVAVGVVLVWLTYSATLGYLGIVSSKTLRVPGIFVMLFPVIAFVAIVVVRSSLGLKLALRIPLFILIGFQAFRIGVELTIHRLWELGTVPALMTLSGGNIEILIGISAPFVAWFCARGQGLPRIVLVWNGLGLLSLLNIAARSVLTAPGPLHFLHAEVLNTALGTFPFSLIPGFLAPLALMLHVLAFRALRSRALPTDLARPVGPHEPKPAP